MNNLERKENYKMKSLSKKALLLTAVVGTGFLFESNQVHVHAATAKTEITTKVKKLTPVVKNQPQLTKQGYVLRATSNTASKIFVGKANYNRALKLASQDKFLKKGKTVSYKKLKNVKFRVEKELDVVDHPAGAPIYLLASKDKKYSFWTTPAGMEYYYLHNKSLQPVLKPLKKIADRKNTSLKNAQNKRDFAQAMKAAKKLPSSLRTKVMISLKQSQKDGKVDMIDENGNNLMLSGIE